MQHNIILRIDQFPWTAIPKFTNVFLNGYRDADGKTLDRLHFFVVLSRTQCCPQLHVSCKVRCQLDEECLKLIQI